MGGMTPVSRDVPLGKLFICLSLQYLYSCPTLGVFLRRYHGEASNLPNGHVELPEVQRLLAHSGKLGDRRSPFLHEGQVSLHPNAPLRLPAQLE